MKRFLRSFKLKHILLIALIVRLVFVPFIAEHTDLTTNAIWGIYAREFGLRGYYDWLNFGNYARPEYPPLSTLLFLLIRIVWQGIFSVLWFINVNLKAFPSGLVSWFDNFGNLALLKLPGVLADIGIGVLIFNYTKSKKLAALYLFNPAVIYLSAVWGQTESFIALFALLGILLFLKKNYFQGFWCFFVSFLTKASMLPAFPVIALQSLKAKMKKQQVIILIICLLAGAYFVGSLFTDHLPIWWLIRNYKDKFIVGPLNLLFINLNAFNFWGLTLGLGQIPDAPYRLTAWIISGVFFLVILNKFRQKSTNIFFALAMIFFAAFMFLPRMHERYLFPIFVFFPFILAKFPKLTRVFYLLSGVFLFNLYHGWWIPNIPPLMYLLDLELVERGLSAVNLAAFGYLIWKYQSS